MRFRRRYTLYPVKTKKGKRIWYFRVYIDGRRKARTTGCTSKEKAIMYVETLLCEPNRLKKLFGCSLSMELDSGTSAIVFANRYHVWRIRTKLVVVG
ncbi:MAG: hypothetical protein ACTTJZ_02730 [Sphaerochaetaceae bacterium]